MPTDRKYRMPRIIRLICSISNSWIVGSAADPNIKRPHDYDVAVPYSEWKYVARLIPKDAKPTLFGGWKFISDGKEIDVWPDEIMNMFTCAKCEWMWQPQYNIRVRRQKNAYEKNA